MTHTLLIHSLEIEPVLQAGEEFRLESLCVAGPQAEVLPDG